MNWLIRIGSTSRKSTNHIAHSQFLFVRFRMEYMAAAVILKEREASVSTSVVLIHSSSEDSSDSDSASIASVNQG